MRCYKCKYYIPHSYSSYEIGNCGLFLDFESCPTDEASLGCKYNKKTLDKMNKIQDQETREEFKNMGIDID